MTTYPRASVHGRFQPFHNGHLEYVVEALARSDFLIVGITQHVIRRLVQVPNADAVHRAEPHSNPLSYYERATMIDAVFEALSVPRTRYAVTPFPIEEPEHLTDFLPTSVPVLTTTYDSWNRDKIATLERLGYQVENLWSREHKDVEGHQIREMIKNDDERWKQFVPDTVVPLIEAYGVAERLVALTPGRG
jgi:cytidyltransferase-like protein